MRCGGGARVSVEMHAALHHDIHMQAPCKYIDRGTRFVRVFYKAFICAVSCNKTCPTGK